MTAARRDKGRRAREARERAEWERSQQERLRYVSVRCGLEVHEPDLLGNQQPAEVARGADGGGDGDDDGGDDDDEPAAAGGDKKSAFEPASFDRIDPGLHVVARFGGVEDDHLYPGTVYDCSRAAEGLYGVQFDDGDVDDAVPRASLRVPRVRSGDRVEATFDDGGEFLGLDPDLPTKCVVCGRRPEIRCVQCDEVYCMWMGKPRCFRKHHNKGKRRDHTHVPYELLDSIDGRVKAEEEAEVQREVDRTRRRQLAAEEFLRHCEAQKAEERERERVVDDAAEELLQEQLKLEASTKRNRTIRWLLDSFSKMLPGPLRRSLSPLRERFPVEAKITHADVRARKQGGRSRTVSGVTAANLFSAASSRGKKR